MHVHQSDFFFLYFERGGFDAVSFPREIDNEIPLSKLYFVLEFVSGCLV